MPLTKHQLKIAKLLAQNRAAYSHLAGGAALHILPSSLRFSDDLDYFHDSAAQAVAAASKDLALLEREGYSVSTELRTDGMVRSIVRLGKESTKIEWVHDSEWRFMPAMQHPDSGFQLHTVDLAINKILACAGRNEPRDLLDAIYIHNNILRLGAVVWAAVGKDPGFSPVSLLEQLRRRGRFQQEDFDRLALTKPVDVKAIKKEWLQILDEAEAFIKSRPAEEVGCLYYSTDGKGFLEPVSELSKRVVLHRGSKGGTLPKNWRDEASIESIGSGLTKGISKGARPRRMRR